MVLNIIFGFLVPFHPVISVLLFSVFVLVLINIFYKILINQADAKQLKEKTKELNKQAREAQKSGNKEESNRLLSEMMRENSRLMKMTMKPMIVSFIIVILLLPWPADIYGDRTVTLENGAGEMVFRDVNYAVTGSDNSVTVQDVTCELPCMETIGNIDFEISKEGSNIKFSPVVAILPVAFPFVGNTLGWLGWYILISIPLAILIRKFMKIYV